MLLRLRLVVAWAGVECRDLAAWSGVEWNRWWWSVSIVRVLQPRTWQ